MFIVVSWCLVGHLFLKHSIFINGSFFSWVPAHRTTTSQGFNLGQIKLQVVQLLRIGDLCWHAYFEDIYTPFGCHRWFDYLIKNVALYCITKLFIFALDSDCLTNQIVYKTPSANFNIHKISTPLNINEIAGFFSLFFTTFLL